MGNLVERPHLTPCSYVSWFATTVLRVFRPREERGWLGVEVLGSLKRTHEVTLDLLSLAGALPLEPFSATAQFAFAYL